MVKVYPSVACLPCSIDWLDLPVDIGGGGGDFPLFPGFLVNITMLLAKVLRA
jgi:hypothetical protein